MRPLLGPLACPRTSLSRGVRPRKRASHEENGRLRFWDGDVRSWSHSVILILQSRQLTLKNVTHAPLQVLSGSFPFQGLRNEAVILRVRSGDHPRWPQGGSDLGPADELWNIMKLCWQRRDRRCEISRVVSTLSQASLCGGNAGEAF